MIDLVDLIMLVIITIQGRAVDPRTFWGFRLNPRTVLGLDFFLSKEEIHNIVIILQSYVVTM